MESQSADSEVYFAVEATDAKGWINPIEEAIEFLKANSPGRFATTARLIPVALQLDRFKRSSHNGAMPKTLLHGLFPVVRAEILRLLFTNPGQELYVRQLARLSFLSLQTVQDELAKLETSDLILSRSNGYHRFYRANPGHPLYAALRRMVIKGALHPKRPTPARGSRGRRRRSISKARK